MSELDLEALKRRGYGSDCRITRALIGELEACRAELEHALAMINGRNDALGVMLARAERAEAELAQYVADANDGYLGVLHRARDAETRIAAALEILGPQQSVTPQWVTELRRALTGGDQ